MYNNLLFTFTLPFSPPYPLLSLSFKRTGKEERLEERTFVEKEKVRREWDEGLGRGKIIKTNEQLKRRKIKINNNMTHYILSA